MSVVGGAYKYDIFFSYAWAEETKNPALRNWTRMVIDQIVTLLETRFAKIGELKCYLDRDENTKSAVSLENTLQQAAENAAVFIALISPYYESEYCQMELNWFLDRVDAEGQSPAERVCLFLIQDDKDMAWPERLCEANGKRLLYKTLHGERGQPLEFAAFLNHSPTPALANPIQDAAMEIGDKLNVIRDAVRAKDIYKASQRLPDNPVLLLEAEAADEQSWTARRGELTDDASSIVLPAKAPPAPATSFTDPWAAYEGCDGVVLLRSRPGDEIGRRIKQAYRDRRQIFREGKGMIAWALLDELDEAPPESEAFEIPRVVARGKWVPELQLKLFEV